MPELTEATREGTVESRPIDAPKAVVAEHPYLRVRRLRANEYYRQAWHLWLSVLANLGLLLLLGGVVMAYIHLSTKARIHPYVVEVDRHGTALAFEPAVEMADPDERMKQHTIALWLRSVRTVTADREIQRDLIWKGHAYTSGRAVTLLNAWWRRDPPFARAEEHTVTVEILSILKAGGRNNYKVQWLEDFHARGGSPLQQEHWEAFLTLAIDPPALVEEVLSNPLGITITDFDWSRLPEPEGDD
jgi:type IV secretion system protein VirB5